MTDTGEVTRCQLCPDKPHLSNLIVIRVVPWCDLECASAEFPVDILVCDDPYPPAWMQSPFLCTLKRITGQSQAEADSSHHDDSPRMVMHSCKKP